MISVNLQLLGGRGAAYSAYRKSARLTAEKGEYKHFAKTYQGYWVRDSETGESQFFYDDVGMNEDRAKELFVKRVVDERNIDRRFKRLVKEETDKAFKDWKENNPQAYKKMSKKDLKRKREQLAGIISESKIWDMYEKRYGRDDSGYLPFEW